MTTNYIPKGVRGNKKGKSEQLRIISEIRNLLLSNTDYEIMEILGIPNSTYYRYKSKINKQDQELWQKITLDTLESRALKILASLKRCYAINKQIAEDKEVDAKDRMAAAQTMVKAQIHIYFLLKNGPDIEPKYS